MDYLGRPLIVAARSSALSQAQWWELFDFFLALDFCCQWQPLWVKTTGDKRLDCSLRQLDKSDFFTKELDELLLEGKCDAAIHSAKDLPDPIRDGLIVAAMTTGIDDADVLVMPPGKTIETLPLGTLVGTSSARRDQMVRQLRPDLRCVDIRGTIEQRLKNHETVVVAKAALIRLRLLHRLNWVVLPGTTASGQGKLAVIVKDKKMQEYFQRANEGHHPFS